jgi:pimeloyl-ACP methyl ester carboxylesterase
LRKKPQYDEESGVLILKGAGHAVMFDRPRAFNAAVLDFLSGQPVGK